MTSLLKQASVSPVVIGAALLVPLKGPENIQQPVYDYLHQLLKPHNLDRLITTLKWLLAYDWNNETAVVTSSPSGFDALFSKDLWDKAIHIVAIDINPLPANLQNNPKITFFKCDVTNVDAVNTVTKGIQSKVGHPTILINNAGIGS
ncbi:hypothetical protein E4T44_01040 [Aureobasidium sp. EXF-8845]|nr:hypothetical protein E4T44_01040 [Aureobasidium sp. EXF-8845]KAI4857501.1 hypothetical protein E4T45_01004 [Aureobasidium sp. EXF-8846]